MDFEFDAPSSDIIAMNLTIAALDRWLQNVSSERSGLDLGREIASLYREIHAAVDEMSPDDADDDLDFDDDDEDEDEEYAQEAEDERD